MRLSCPNCDAQYEVDDNVVPRDGRDVQCSSCGKTWFQKSAEQLAQEDNTVIRPHRQEPQPEQVQEPEPEQPIAPEPKQTPESIPEPAATEPELKRQETDQDALDILREEAAIEAAARLKDAQGTVETQTDLGLEQTPAVQNKQDTGTNERTARMRGIHAPVDKNASPGDMLPDIEEINSSLRASSVDEENTEDEETADEKPRRSGFRMGFSLVILLAVIALLAYIYAPLIAEKMPASQPYLESYVDMVNGLRSWLDQLMKSATAKISGDGS